MSRNTYDVIETYTGTGSLATYTFDFKIEALKQLLIIEMDDAGAEVQRVRGDDTTYLSSVTFDSTVGGGTIVLAANLTINHKLIILLANDEPTQKFQFSNKLSFNLKRIENALDFVVGSVQRLARRANQAFRLHESEDLSTFDAEFPPGIADQKGRPLIVNQAGDGLTYGLSTSEIEAGKLPAGGDTDAALVKVSNTNGDADWDNLEISGYSDRFNTAWSSKGLRDTLEKIIDLVYAAPLVSLSGSSNTLREKGDSVSGITLSANVTKRSDNIAKIEFFVGATSIQVDEPPTQTGSGVTTAPYAPGFSDTTTFNVEVTDDGTTGGPTTVSDSTTYNFVYPYYYGADVPGISAANVASLTKNIINSSSDLTRNFTTADGDVYYFAYPASYGDLSSILDENGFETLSGWTKTVENITGLDASAVSYNIYEFNNTVTAGTTNFRFIR